MDFFGQHNVRGKTLILCNIFTLFPSGCLSLSVLWEVNSLIEPRVDVTSITEVSNDAPLKLAPLVDSCPFPGAVQHLRGMAHPPLNEFVKFGRKILGAGINYRSLIAARNLPLPKEPIIFLKCSTSYITEGQSIIVPSNFNIHQEVELGVVIGKAGKYINENEAFDYVGGYCLALDMTEAEIMAKSRKEGLPWTLGKAFDASCPVSRFITKTELPNPENIRIFSKVNNKIEQDSLTSDLVFTIPELISFISQYMTLEPGDLILTGSPAGTGPVKPGDMIECGIGDILTMKFAVKSA